VSVEPAFRREVEAVHEARDIPCGALAVVQIGGWFYSRVMALAVASRSRRSLHEVPLSHCDFSKPLNGRGCPQLVAAAAQADSRVDELLGIDQFPRPRIPDLRITIDSLLHTPPVGL